MSKFSMAKVSLYGMICVGLSVLFSPDVAFFILLVFSFIHDILGITRLPNPFRLKKPEWIDLIHCFVGCFFGSGFVYAYINNILMAKMFFLFIFVVMIILEKLGTYIVKIGD